MDNTSPTPKIKRLVTVDEWLYDWPTSSDDPNAYARFVLDNFRKSAGWQSMVRPWMKQFKLFGTYQGKRYRITGASRFGDVYLQPNFDVEHGYEERVTVTDISEWSDKP